MVLKQMFELIYDSNHLFCLNFKIACTYFRIKSYFKTCLNTQDSQHQPLMHNQYRLNQYQYNS